MPEKTCENDRFQRQTRENPPCFMIEFREDEKQFRVKAGKVYYGWFADSPSNRKAVLVFLREMYDVKTGRWVFTEEALAGLVGSANRQATDCHMKGFRAAEGELLNFFEAHAQSG